MRESILCALSQPPGRNTHRTWYDVFVLAVQPRYGAFYDAWVRCGTNPGRWFWKSWPLNPPSNNGIWCFSADVTAAPSGLLTCENETWEKDGNYPEEWICEAE